MCCYMSWDAIFSFVTVSPLQNFLFSHLISLLFICWSGFFFCVPFDIWLNDTKKKQEQCVLSLFAVTNDNFVPDHLLRSAAIEMNRFFIGFFHVNAFLFATSHSIFPDANWHTIWIDAFETVHGSAKWFLHRLTLISLWSSIPEFTFFYWLIFVKLKSLISLFFSKWYDTLWSYLGIH